MNDKKLALIFKALGDENRVQILRLLQGGEKCACMLLKELDICQSTLSHHMKILCDAEIVTCRKDGKWMYYSLCCENVHRLRIEFRNLISPDKIPGDCVCKCVCKKAK